MDTDTNSCYICRASTFGYLVSAVYPALYHLDDRTSISSVALDFKEEIKYGRMGYCLDNIFLTVTCYRTIMRR